MELRCGRYMDVELQQRAVEYLSLEKQPELARANVTAMPPWEKRKSLLLRRMAEREVRSASSLHVLPSTLPVAVITDKDMHSLAWTSFDGTLEMREAGVP